MSAYHERETFMQPSGSKPVPILAAETVDSSGCIRDPMTVAPPDGEPVSRLAGTVGPEIQNAGDLTWNPDAGEIRDLTRFSMDQEWFFHSLQPSILQITGYEAGEFLGRKICWLSLIHRKDRERVQRSVKKAVEGDGYFLAEFRILRKMGDMRWVKMRGPITRSSEGGFLSLRGVINDVTTRKRMEYAFDSEHEVFMAMANSIDDGIYIVGDDYRIRFMNRPMKDLFGNHEGEICHQAFFGRDEICSWSAMASYSQSSCGFQEISFPNLERVFHIRNFSIRTGDGGYGKIGILKDVTKTKKLERKLRDFALRVRAIAKAANMAQLGIFILEDHEEMEARFRFANQAFCQICGYGQEELQDKSFMELLHKDSLEEVTDRYRRRLAGEVFNDAYEVTLNRRDTTPITGLFMGARTLHAGNIATVGFFRDITARREWQKSIWLSQKLASIGKLSAEIAHEINNPLTSVLTFNKLIEKILQQQPFPQDRIQELREYAQFVNTEAKRCADIARNLLNFSRNHEISIKEHDIHEVLTKTLDILRHRAEMNRIEITTSYADDLPPLCCDFNRIQQAFLNLFWNAIEAMPEGGTLSVSTVFDSDQPCDRACKAGKNMIRIIISDTGVGIPEENLERIFEPFFSTKSEKSGVGLGLSVSYGIISKHQGRIQVQSEVGKGTVFSVFLPTGLCTTCKLVDG
jgi:PAS domain S-box-containing protein